MNRTEQDAWMLLLSLLVSLAQAPLFAATAVDPNLKPDSEDEFSNVFRDMGVVQRKAMSKGGRFLFSAYNTLDFSDGAYTNYALHFNPGFAISDFLEVYVNVAPVYFTSARSIVQKVSQLYISPGVPAKVTAAMPRIQYGIEILWAPLYGKDSLGISKIIRSDTFLKFGASQVQYDVATGLKFNLGVGKTFFLGKSVGLRFCIDYGLVQGIVMNQDSIVTGKSFQSMLLTELGAVFYL